MDIIVFRRFKNPAIPNKNTSSWIMSCWCLARTFCGKSCTNCNIGSVLIFSPKLLHKNWKNTSSQSLLFYCNIQSILPVFCSNRSINKRSKKRWRFILGVWAISFSQAIQALEVINNSYLFKSLTSTMFFSWRVGIVSPKKLRITTSSSQTTCKITLL